MSIKEIAAAYRQSTEAFERLVAGIPSDQLDTKHPEGWSARQVIHHMADSEAQSYGRIRRLIAEPEGTSIQGYDENAWGDSAVLGYATLPIDFSVKVFSVEYAQLRMVLNYKLLKLGKTHSECAYLVGYKNHSSSHHSLYMCNAAMRFPKQYDLIIEFYENL